MQAELSEVHYRFRGAEREALAGVSFDLREGEVLGLIGPDGAGKTTLLRLMAGVLKASSGRLSVLGLDPLKQHAELSRRVGYMTQRFSMYEDLSIRANLKLYAALHRIPRSDIEQRMHALLAAAGLLPFTERPAGKLSGGMKQKLALICAMFGEPDIMLLDEPGVGVDPVSRRDLWQLVEHARSSGRSIIWSTAYMDEAARCDRVCVLHEGRIRYLGSPDALLEPLRGRVYALPSAPLQRLADLHRARQIPGVMDAMIEGSDVRFTLRRKPETAEGLPEQAHTVEPKFEEAFIDLLGGLPQAETSAAAALPPSKPTDEVVIETRGLTRRFGTFTATDHLSIQVHRGEIFGLLGANGAGKTTAFRMMCGLLKPSDGSARILGIDLRREARRAREHIGYMAQKYALYANLSAEQNLAFFAAVYGLRGAQREQRIAEAVQSYHLTPYLRGASGMLPPGIKQRLSMACATLHRPEFLFLDEPTSGVDPFVRREFWEKINEMAARGVTIIVTTHFMDEAQYMHRMVIMNQGRVIAGGTPEELKTAAATPDNPQPTMEDAFIRYIREGGTAC